jgi:hypothetical protein
MNYDHDAHEALVRSCRKTRAWPDKPQHKGPHIGVVLAAIALVAVLAGVALRVML